MEGKKMRELSAGEGDLFCYAVFACFSIANLQSIS
jgi:hypothetical protein